ncbi:MAG: hypothetical protein ACAI35_17615 [Candidatus Methylacidiphilales bacterium]|nr:hypothetical protein [Candidatus Methylacidiphilales bacterium]
MPPFVGRAPDVSGWKIVFQPIKTVAKPGADPATPSTAANTRPALVHEITVYKAGERRKELIPSPRLNGGREERFYYKGIVFYQKPGFAPTDVYTQSSPGGADTDFPELAWIKAEHYTGVKREGGKRYYLFSMAPQQLAARLPAPGMPARSGPVKTLPQQGADIERIMFRVWIDVDTKLPLKFDDGAYQRNYQFFPSSASNAEPSPAIRLRADALGK